MAIEIEDGGGTGRRANVTLFGTKGRLDASARTATRQFYVNRDEGQSYVLYIDITPTGAADNFMYLKNTSTTKNMYVAWYRFWTPAGSSEAIDILVDAVGTPAGTTAVTPTNLNRESGNAAAGEFYEGVNITGLSGETQLDRVRIVGGSDVLQDLKGELILPPAGVATLQAVNGAIAIEATIGIYFE